MLDVGVPISATFLVIVGLKILMLVIESRGKTNYLKPDYQRDHQSESFVVA
jgi:hypothetical protein